MGGLSTAAANFTARRIKSWHKREPKGELDIGRIQLPEFTSTERGDQHTVSL